MTDTKTNIRGGAEKAPAITLADLAKKIGLSKSTVSRALSDYPDISSATKERVVKAATEHGYRPSSYAQSIRTGQMKSVALILSVSQDTIQDASLAAFLDGVSSALGQEAWTLTVATAADSQTDIDLQRRLIGEKKVDGFIIPRLRNNDERVALMKASGTPFVVYGRPSEGDPCAFYDVRSEACMAEAVETLHGLGHRRIGFIGPDARFVMTDLREAGYASGLQNAGLAFDPALVRRGAMNQGSGAKLALELLCQPSPPTAIVCGMDAAALGVYRILLKLGLTAGREVSIIGYDGIPEGEYVTPGLTTYANDSVAAGANLATLLLQRIRGSAPETLQVLADATLVERGSHGAPVWSSDELAAHVAKTRSNWEE